MGQKGNSGDCQRRLQQLVCGKQEDRVRHTQMVHATALCDLAWDMCLSVLMGIGCWNVGFRGQTWREDCCWLQWDSLRGWEWGNLQWGMLMEETQTTVTMKIHCWVTDKEWEHYCSLCLHELIPASLGTKKSFCQGQLSQIHGHCLPCIPHPCKGWVSCACIHQLPHDSCSHQGSCNPRGCWLCTSSLLDRTLVLCSRIRSRTLWVTHTQRWGWKHNWAPEAMQLRKKTWHLCMWKLQIYTLTGFVSSVPTEHFNGQQVLL